MNREQYLIAMDATLEVGFRHGMKNMGSDHKEADWPHLWGMRNRMREDDQMSRGKMGRWLGWVQACVVIQSTSPASVNLETMKQINTRCQEEGATFQRVANEALGMSHTAGDTDHDA